MKKDTKTEIIRTQYAHEAKDLKELIRENPELPILFMACEDAVDGDYSTTFCGKYWAELGEVLDCEIDWTYDRRIFTDRTDFRDAIFCEYDFPELSDDATDETADEMIRRIEKTYEPYWKKCIIVTVGN